MVSSGGDRSEIAFFDVETTIPTRRGQGFAILEFGAILVCPRKLVELDSYSNLVRPSDLSLITSLSVRCNGISRDAVVSAPTFAEIADRVYDILNGRIWAGHNILRFDCARIREAFAGINRPAPEPKGTIDSLALLTQRFGRRAGDMKMATLATYFGLGQQTHRSLDDVRMNLEVLKYCATVLFLESSLPDILATDSWVSPNSTTRSGINGKASVEGSGSNPLPPSLGSKFENHQILTHNNQSNEEIHPIVSLMTPNTGEEVPTQVVQSVARTDPFDMGPLSDQMEPESLQSDDTMEEETHSESFESCTSGSPNSSAHGDDFIMSEEISISSISVQLVPFFRGTRRIQILHKDIPLQVCSTRLKVRFGISSKFVDYAGRPRLNFVVDASPSLCRVLETCDNLAHKLSVDSGSSSEWRPSVIRRAGFLNSPTVRLHLPMVTDGNVTRWDTEIYQKESSRVIQKLVFSEFDVAELDALIFPGTLVDVCFSLDPYDYQQNAGIRLVAKKLVVHSS